MENRKQLGELCCFPSHSEWELPFENVVFRTMAANLIKNQNF